MSRCRSSQSRSQFHATLFTCTPFRVKRDHHPPIVLGQLVDRLRSGRRGPANQQHSWDSSNPLDGNASKQKVDLGTCVSRRTPRVGGLHTHLGVGGVFPITAPKPRPSSCKAGLELELEERGESVAAQEVASPSTGCRSDAGVSLPTAQLGRESLGRVTDAV